MRAPLQGRMKRESIAPSRSKGRPGNLPPLKKSAANIKIRSAQKHEAPNVLIRLCLPFLMKIT